VLDPETTTTCPFRRRLPCRRVDGVDDALCSFVFGAEARLSPAGTRGLPRKTWVLRAVAAHTSRWWAWIVT
jgi:hypothetical protein